eukprot:2034262-Pleurochrysis_carterae.AAC.3
MAAASASGELRLLRVAVPVGVRARRGDAIHARCKIAPRKAVVPRTAPALRRRRRCAASGGGAVQPATAAL